MAEVIQLPDTNFTNEDESNFYLYRYMKFLKTDLNSQFCDTKMKIKIMKFEF